MIEHLKSIKYSGSDLTSFTAFQLKLVMKGTNSAYPPRVKDLRGIVWQFNCMSTVKVKGHTHLVRDLKSQAIINTDSDAYARYMARKAKQQKKMTR